MEEPNPFLHSVTADTLVANLMWERPADLRWVVLGFISIEQFEAWAVAHANRVELEAITLGHAATTQPQRSIEQEAQRDNMPRAGAWWLRYRGYK